MDGQTKAKSMRRDPPVEVVTELESAGIPAGSYEFQPLDAVRRTIARRMTDSFRDVPHFGLQSQIEIDGLLALRARLNARPDIVRISLNDLIVKASALALKRVPSANASYTTRGLIFHKHADIAIAVAIEGGLVTPIVRCAEEKTVEAISLETKDLAERGRAKRLRPEEYFGGTFSISNLGMFGVSSFGSVLNPPQGAILSVGEPAKQFRFKGDEPYVATVLTVTLTCDHRVVDGAIGAVWLRELKGLLEAPETWVQ